MLPPPDFAQRPISLSSNPKIDSIKKVAGQQMFYSEFTALVSEQKMG